MSEQEFHLHIEGIRGEAKHAKFKDWIDVLSWSCSVSQLSSMDRGGGGGVGKAKFNEMALTHTIDRASPNLVKYCAAGRHIPRVTLVLSKAGGGSIEYARYVMEDCIITHVHPVGRPGRRNQLRESFGIDFSRIRIEIKEQKPDGGMGASVCSGWDVKANKEC